jgi:tetratricopeptide (TPR) repeat protein
MTSKRVNWKLLGVLAGGLALSAAAVAGVHAVQVRREAAELLARADEAERDGQAGRAAARLRRYLSLAPEDADALARYAGLLDGQAGDDEARWRAVSAYEQVLARDPSREEARRRLAALAMDLGDYGLARDQLQELLRRKPGAADVEDLLGQCYEATGEPEKAAESYRRAVDHDPTRVAAYARLAALLYDGMNRAADADRLLDDLTRADGDDAAAWLARAAYRDRHGDAAGAEKDVARARELAPDDGRVLLAAADLAYRRGAAGEARDALRRGRAAHPDDVSLCVALTTLELECGRPAEAAAAAREGLVKNIDQPDLLNLLTEALLRQGDEAGADAVIARAREHGPAGLAGYLAARQQMRRKHWGEAARALAEEATTADLSPGLALRAWLCLAECYEYLGDADRRFAASRRAVEADPSSGPARVGLGAALLAAGRTDEALDQLRQAERLAQPPPALWPVLARALLAQARGLPAEQRDWREVERVLDRADAAPGQEAAAALARADVLRARGRSDEADALLERERAKDAGGAGPWLAAAVRAARGGDAAAAKRVLDEARGKLGDRVELRLAELELWAEPEEAARGGAPAALEKDAETLPPEDRTLLLCRVAEAYYRLGKGSEGDRLCRLLADRPADLAGRLLLLDAAAQCRDDETAARVVADVRRLEGEDGAGWRCGEAARLVVRAGRGDKSGLDRARTLLTEAAARRPEWARVALLQAEVAELDSDAAKAADDYQKAFDLGDRRHEVALRLLGLLARRGRWEDADRVARKWQEQAVPHGALARLAAEAALRTGANARAVELARLAAPTGADDAVYRVWLGGVLDAAGRSDDAEAELRAAVRLAGGDWEATAALANHLALLGRGREADEAIEALKDQLPPRYAALPLARCYEAEGRFDRAAEYYRGALERRPSDATTLRRAAAFELRRDRPAAAEPLLRRLLAPGVEAAPDDAAWARRRLAMVLAADGDDRKFAEAKELVADERDDAAGRRVRAFVEASRPDGRRAALRTLEESAKEAPPDAEESLRLARLYDEAGDWPAAQSRLHELVTADKLNPEYLAVYVAALLRHGERDAARPWVERLDGLEPGSARVKEFRAALAAAPRP